MPEAPEPVLSTGPLLLIALGAVLLLLFLIMRVRLHAFVALVLVSLLVAIATRIPTGDIVDTLVGGLGTTLGSVALLVGFGAMLGRLLEVTGGAQVLADALLSRFREDRAPLALGIAALLFGFPIFFDAGLVVFLPLVFVVARRMGGSLLRYGLPVAGAFAVMHAFVPPHPGPVAAAELIGANIGLVLVFGLLIGLPTWYVGAYLFGTWIAERVHVPVPDVLGTGNAGQATDRAADEAVEGTTAGPGRGADGTGDQKQDGDGLPPPSLGTVLFVLLLPLGLIFLNTGLSTLGTAGTIDEEAPVVEWAILIGQTPIALLIALIAAMYLLGWRRRRSGSDVEEIANSALGPVCAIILITGAGGMLGAVLRAGGVGTALSTTLEDIGLPVIVAAFVISVALRVAQGSATVALTTTAGIMAPVIEATEGLSEPDLALIVIAIAGGATVLSHVNDSGFWLVSRFFGMDEKTTLKTWTVMETLLGTIGFSLALGLSLVL
ncbi:MAG: GntP family permease [Solirubrobacteraceae bacterium]|nr:GntP family permease [Solirubrobacteraceae bacterium]